MQQRFDLPDPLPSPAGARLQQLRNVLRDDAVVSVPVSHGQLTVARLDFPDRESFGSYTRFVGVRTFHEGGVAGAVFRSDGSTIVGFDLPRPLSVLLHVPDALGLLPSAVLLDTTPHKLDSALGLLAGDGRPRMRRSTDEPPERRAGVLVGLALALGLSGHDLPTVSRCSLERLAACAAGPLPSGGVQQHTARTVRETHLLGTALWGARVGSEVRDAPLERLAWLRWADLLLVHQRAEFEEAGATVRTQTAQLPPTERTALAYRLVNLTRSYLPRLDLQATTLDAASELSPNDSRLRVDAFVMALRVGRIESAAEALRWLVYRGLDSDTHAHLVERLVRAFSKDNAGYDTADRFLDTVFRPLRRELLTDDRVDWTRDMIETLESVLVGAARADYCRKQATTVELLLREPLDTPRLERARVEAFSRHLLLEKRPELAREVIEQHLKRMGPGVPATEMYLLGDAWVAAGGDVLTFNEWIDDLVQAEEKTSWQYALFRARCAEAAGDPRRAFEQLERCVAGGCAGLPVHRRIVELLLGQRALDDAQRAAERLSILDFFGGADLLYLVRTERKRLADRG